MKNFKTSKEKFEYAKKIILSCETYSQLSVALNLCPILKDKWQELQEWIEYRQKVLELEYYNEDRYQGS